MTITISSSKIKLDTQKHWVSWEKTKKLNTDSNRGPLQQSTDTLFFALWLKPVRIYFYKCFICDHFMKHETNPRKYSSHCRRSVKCNFPLQSAGDNYTLLRGTKTIRSREGNRLQALVDGLVPYSRYTVQVNASNSRGSLLSDLVSVEMPPGGESVKSGVGFLVLNRRPKNRVASELCVLELSASAVVLRV